MKRTPLKRSTKQLTRTPLTASRKPLKSRGRRGKRLYAEASTVYGQVAEEEQTCRKCGTSEGKLDIHHLLPRSSGREQTKRENLIRLCHADHMWAHSHPIEAKEQGFLRSRHNRD